MATPLLSPMSVNNGSARSNAFSAKRRISLGSSVNSPRRRLSIGKENASINSPRAPFAVSTAENNNADGSAELTEQLRAVTADKVAAEERCARLEKTVSDQHSTISSLRKTVVRLKFALASAQADKVAAEERWSPIAMGGGGGGVGSVMGTMGFDTPGTAAARRDIAFMPCTVPRTPATSPALSAAAASPAAGQLGTELWHRMMSDQHALLGDHFGSPAGLSAGDADSPPPAIAGTSGTPTAPTMGATPMATPTARDNAMAENDDDDDDDDDDEFYSPEQTAPAVEEAAEAKKQPLRRSERKRAARARFSPSEAAAIELAQRRSLRDLRLQQLQQRDGKHTPGSFFRTLLSPGMSPALSVGSVNTESFRLAGTGESLLDSMSARARADVLKKHADMMHEVVMANLRKGQQPPAATPAASPPTVEETAAKQTETTPVSVVSASVVSAPPPPRSALRRSQSAPSATKSVSFGGEKHPERHRGRRHGRRRKGTPKIARRRRRPPPPPPRTLRQQLLSPSELVRSPPHTPATPATPAPTADVADVADVAAQSPPMVDEDAPVVITPDGTRSLSEAEEIDNLFSLVRHDHRGDVKAALRDLAAAAAVLPSAMGGLETLRDGDGNTLLHVACQNGLKKMAKLILRHQQKRVGGDSERFARLVEATNTNGRTPLQYCAIYQHDDVGKYLVEKAGAVAE